jgi:hypothetical protein
MRDARVAELADARDLKSLSRKGVKVQVLSRVSYFEIKKLIVVMTISFFYVNYGRCSSEQDTQIRMKLNNASLYPTSPDVLRGCEFLDIL